MMTAEHITIRYDTKHAPTIRDFHCSNADIRGIMGPIGSGKSSACCIEIMKRAARQVPDKYGRRKTRWAIIRNTYPELKSTTIKTWQEWCPPEVCHITFGSPIEARMTSPLSDGTIIDMEIFFMSLDKPQDVRKLLSLELTGAWINEAREVSLFIVEKVLERTGRYPKKSVAPITWTGLIMDTNPPDTDHWWYKMAEEIKPSNWAFFKQPGALRPVYDSKRQISEFVANQDAENVVHQQLGYEYWRRLVPGRSHSQILVDCCGQYGSVFVGRPVYQELYADSLHCSDKPLGVFRGLPLHLGFDFGLTPACIIGQITPTGQLRILRELVCERGGVKQFVENQVRPMLSTYFPNMQIATSTGDPAGAAGADENIELTCFGQLESMGIPSVPAPTNKILPRIKAVTDRLTRTIDGQPAIILDPSCSVLRKGFLGGYKFERVQVTGEERFKDEPAKNKYSHPHDALQYLVLGVDYVETVTNSEFPLPPSTSRNWKAWT